MRKETESVIKNLPTQKSSWWHGFTGYLYQTFKEEFTPIFLKFFPKFLKMETFPKSSHEASITLTPNPYKDITVKL